MHGFLLQAAPKSEQAYEFFTYSGPKINLNFRGTEKAVQKGDRFGVRPSSSGRHIRLIFPGEATKVYTLDMETAKRLARGVSREHH